MKTILKRSLALLLALLMVATVCACSGDGGKNDGDGKTYEKLPGEETTDLNGYEFTVVDFSDGRWNKEKSGTPYNDAWLQIMDEVENLYNCTIKTLPTIAPAEMFSKIQPEMMAGGKYADIICATQWEYGKFLGADLMMDLNQLNVNWDNEWWNQNIREIGTFNGKTTVGSGSFIFDTAQTWLLYYNAAIWEQLGFEDPYKLIDEHRWTQDLFAEYCRKAAQDRDNSGMLDSTDDRFGVIAADGDFCRAWYMALGGKYFTTDKNGRVVLGTTGERTYSIIEKMTNMVKNDKTVSKIKFENEAEKITMFSNGGSLFYAYMPGVSGLQNMEDDWGVMPLPLYDSDQPDYLSGVDHNSTVFGVSKNNQQIKEVSIVLEALGRHAMILENIYWPDYKETYWRHEEQDTRVVSEYVVGHGQHDLALFMQNCDNIFRNPMNKVFDTVYGTASSDFASYVDQVEDAINTKVGEYFGY